MIQLYHNPRCSKSRQTLTLLEQNEKTFEIIDYLNHPPSAAQINHILSLLGITAHQIIRTKESILVKQGITLDRLTESECINLICEHPILLERPIVINGNRAVIGRPPELVLTII